MNSDINLLTEQVLGAAFEVSNTLGVGFLEKVYERALAHELKLRGIHVVTQASLSVRYKGEHVGDYYTDLLVEGVLMVELKCVERLAKEHTAQCLNYLKASSKSICLLINFQSSKVEWKRLIREF
jgi:GxxExxY protein